MKALILAAGMGTRIPEISKDSHKALIINQGKTNIEQSIDYLLEVGVKEIGVVTGHNAHLFQFLEKKYKEVTLIYNKEYQTLNNLYSFQLGLDYFDDSFVLDADVILRKNIFEKAEDSFYYTIQRPKDILTEWIPIVEEGRVVRMEVSDAYKPSMLGVSYWNKEACTLFKNYLQSVERSAYEDPKRYWDHIPLLFYKELVVRTKEISVNDAIEVDTPEDYQSYLQMEACKSTKE